MEQRGRHGQECLSDEEQRFVEVAGSMEPVQHDVSLVDEERKEPEFEEEKENTEEPRSSSLGLSLNSAGDRENPYVMELRKGIEQMKEINKVVYTYYQPVISAIKINDTMNIRMKDFSKANQSLINKLIIMHDNHTKACLALFPELEKELEIWEKQHGEDTKSIELADDQPPTDKAKRELKKTKRAKRPSSDYSKLQDRREKSDNDSFRAEFLDKIDKAYSSRLKVVEDKIARIFAARERILARRKKTMGSSKEKQLRTRGEDC